MYKNEYDSFLGRFYLKSDGENLTGLWVENSKDSLKHEKDLEYAELPIFNENNKWLDIYFERKVPDFILKYKIENITPYFTLESKSWQFFLFHHSSSPI